MSGATILHADLDAFYASVEQRDDPSLRGKPVIVGPGVVLAASYEARAHGVKSAMGAGKARRLCPSAIVVPARWPAYVEASREVFRIFADVSPVVEKLSIDEAFIDVRGLERIGGTPEEIATRLRVRVREDVGLPISIGIASTRALAKVASNAAKPDGLKHVHVGEELAFLHPLPVEALWGVGPATATRLHARGLRTVGQVAALEPATLVGILGRAAGGRVHALAHNHETRALRRRRRGRGSFGSQSALGRVARSPAELDSVLIGLVDRVTRRMRASGRAGRTVVLRLRFDDYTRATRSRTLPRPTAETRAILATLRGLFAEARPLVDARGCTLLGITVTNLDGEPQLTLPIDGPDRSTLDAVLDDVRDRYGPKAVTRAALMRERDTLAAWLMPGDDGVDRVEDGGRPDRL